jgi:hypothetical protein
MTTNQFSRSSADLQAFSSPEHDLVEQHEELRRSERIAKRKADPSPDALAETPEASKQLPGTKCRAPRPSCSDDQQSSKEVKKLLDACYNFMESSLWASSPTTGKPPLSPGPSPASACASRIALALDNPATHAKAIQELRTMANAIIEYQNAERSGHAAATKDTMLAKYPFSEPHIQRLEDVMAATTQPVVPPAANLDIENMSEDILKELLNYCLEEINETQKFVRDDGGECGLYLFIYALLRPLLRAAAGSTCLSAAEPILDDDMVASLAATAGESCSYSALRRYPNGRCRSGCAAEQRCRRILPACSAS